MSCCSRRKEAALRRTTSFRATLVGAGLVVAGLIGCSTGPQDDGLDLGDRIVDSANSLRQSAETTVTAEYRLTRATTSLVAIVPAAGIEPSELPPDTPEQLVSRLREALSMWPGREIVAVLSENDFSSGPVIEGRGLVKGPLAVLKPPRGTVTVVLEKNAQGDVFIADLR